MAMIRTDVKHIGDPFVLLYEGRYYMYATGAPDGFLYWVSDDMKSWQKGGYCYSNSPWAYECFWAPEVFLVNGKFYMFYTARWSKNNSLRIGLAVADRPEGPFKDLKDEPFFDFGYAAIDATLLIDEDGKYYVYYSRDCSENVINGVHTSEIYGMQISPDFKKIIGEPKKLTTPDQPYEQFSGPEWLWNEGPFVIKRAGKYLLNYSTNFYASKHYSLGVATSDSPLGEFKKYKAPVLTFEHCESDFSGPGHNCIFTGKDGKLYTAFHIHTNEESPSGDRKAVIAQVVFTEDGKMQIKL